MNSMFDGLKVPTAE